MQVLSSENYASTMNTQILPFLKKAGKTGIFERVTGQPIYYERYHTENARGVVVLVHGFTEGIGKYKEMIWYFLHDGLDVWLIQQREHGRSFRRTSDPDLIYIEDYNDLIEDAHYFIKNVVCNDPDTASLPLYLFGHSMGGGVCACLLSRYPGIVRKAILSSPMLQMSSGNTPIWAAKLYANLMIFLGMGKQYMPGSGRFNPAYDFENSCATSPERYAWWLEETKAHPDIQMCACAVRTALQFLKLTEEATSEAACKKIITPVLLLQAGKDNMVGAEGQERFIEQIGILGKLVKYPDAKHEIYRSDDETLQKYLDEILAYLTDN